MENKDNIKPDNIKFEMWDLSKNEVISFTQQYNYYLNLKN